MKMFNTMKAKMMAATIAFAGIVMPLAVFASDAPAEAEFSLTMIISGLVESFNAFKGIGWQAGAAALLTVLIGTMKNSMMRSFLWDKLPALVKTLAAPILGVGIMLLTMSEFSWASLLLAFSTGVGAAYLKNILDGLKTIPGIGPTYVMILDLIGSLLRRPGA